MTFVYTFVASLTLKSLALQFYPRCHWYYDWNGYGSIPIDTFLVGWTSIYQLFWGSLGTRVLTHPHMFESCFCWSKITKIPEFLRQVPTDKARAFAFDIDWDAVHVPRCEKLGFGWGIYPWKMVIFHRNSGFTHEKWWFSIEIVDLPMKNGDFP